MIYTQIPTSYKYDVIAEAIYGREIEHFHYDFDRVNFERLIATASDSEYKENIRQRLADTLGQMENVEAIYAALMAQVDDQDAYAEAVKRATQKREDQKNEARPSAKQHIPALHPAR